MVIDKFFYNPWFQLLTNKTNHIVSLELIGLRNDCFTESNCYLTARLNRYRYKPVCNDSFKNINQLSLIPKRYPFQ